MEIIRTVCLEEKIGDHMHVGGYIDKAGRKRFSLCSGDARIVLSLAEALALKDALTEMLECKELV